MIPLAAKNVGGVVGLVLSVVGVVLNLATLWIIGRKKNLRRQPTAVVIVSLLVVNLTYCAVVLPFKSVTYIEGVCWFCHVDSPTCTINGIMFWWNHATIMYTQALLALNRYLVICQPQWTVSLRFTFLGVIIER